MPRPAEHRLARDLAPSTRRENQSADAEDGPRAEVNGEGCDIGEAKPSCTQHLLNTWLNTFSNIFATCGVRSPSGVRQDAHLEPAADRSVETKTGIGQPHGGSARRPAEGTTAQEMHMQMRDALAAVTTVIDNKSETILQSQLTRDLCGRQEEMTEQRLVIGAGLADARYSLARNDEHVRRRLWCDIAESDAVRVLVQERRRDLPLGDALKEGLRHGQRTTTVMRPRPDIRAASPLSVSTAES